MVANFLNANVRVHIEMPSKHDPRVKTVGIAATSLVMRYPEER
jgi:hypothetical protein